MKDIIEALRCGPGSFGDELVEQFVSELSKEHKTHQANVIRNMQKILISYGERMQQRTDLRNKSAVAFCQKVRDMKGTHIDYV